MLTVFPQNQRLTFFGILVIFFRLVIYKCALLLTILIFDRLVLYTKANKLAVWETLYCGIIRIHGGLIFVTFRDSPFHKIKSTETNFERGTYQN